MLQQMLGTAGGMLLCIAGGILLLVIVVGVYIYIVRFKLMKVKIPEGVEVILVKGHPDYPRYVETIFPLRVNLQKAKERAAVAVHPHLEALFGANNTAYFFESDPEMLGDPTDSGYVHVISQEGLYKGRRGEDIDSPRTHMYIHCDDLGPVK